ncbi:MAG: TonB-dependent receptor [Verrucomicrobiota bacterium]
MISATVHQLGRAGFMSLVAGTVALAMPIFATGSTNSPAPTDLTDMSFEQLAAIKVATVYGASKHEQSVDEAPSYVTIITQDDIKKFGYRTLKDILNSVPGFYTTSDGAYDYIGTRGFNRPGDYGGRFLITIDGHRMNDDVFDSAAIGTEFLLDVDLIDRVEVIRGPGSSLYGDNAVLAVINVITRRGRDFNGAEASSSYGSYNTFTGRFSYGNRYTNGLECAVSGTYLGSGGNEGVYYPEFANINNGYAGQNQASKAPGAFASISYKDLAIEGGIVQRTETIPTGAYGMVFDDSRSLVMDERAFADLKFQHNFDGGWDLTARIYYDHYRYDGNYPLPEYAYGDPLYPGQVTINEDRDDQESLGTEAQISKILFEKHRITMGAEYRNDFILQQRNFDVGGPTYLDSNPTADTVGAYAQDEYSILHNLILNAGARYDYFSSFGGTFNPRIALIYSPCTNSTLKAIYGQAFRAPDAYELYYVAPGYTSSETLKPETIHSYELDYDQALGPHLKLVTSLFYYQFDNLISFGLDSSGNADFGNIASATSKGGEIELDAKWSKGWSARLAYTFADARDGATGQRLSDSPENLAKLNLNAPLWHEKIYAGLEILAMSDRTTVQGNELGSYWVANFNIFSRQIVKDLEFSAGIYNLFDRKYNDPVGSDFPEASVQQFGRSFRLKLTYHF